MSAVAVPERYVAISRQFSYVALQEHHVCIGCSEKSSVPILNLRDVFRYGEEGRKSVAKGAGATVQTHNYVVSRACRQTSRQEAHDSYVMASNFSSVS